MSMTAETDRRTIFWRTLLWTGMERSTLVRIETGEHRLEGTAIVLSNATPFEFRYRIETNSRWQTRRVNIDIVSGRERVQELVIDADAGQRWLLDNTPIPGLDGCIDIDLGFSPATNLLPIRRLRLDDGHTVPVRAAWLKFPELVLEPLEQRYTRINGTTYRYESTAGQPRRIELDADGMIVSYEGGWERLS